MHVFGAAKMQPHPPREELIDPRSTPPWSDLRQVLRDDVERLAGCDTAGAEEEYIAHAMVETGRAVELGPVIAPRHAREVEVEVPGDFRDSCIVVGTHYGTPLGVESCAVLLALVRALSGAHPHHSVRIVAFANEAGLRGSDVYLERLDEAGTSVRAMVALERLGFSRERAPLALVADLRDRRLVRAAGAAFRASSRVDARVLFRPGWLPSQRESDAAPFRRAGLPAIGVRGRLTFDGMASAVPGLAAIVGQLAAGNLPTAAPSPA
jgi:hypothetical protein